MPRPVGARSIVSFRQKPLLLRLDVEDSFEIQLVLPAQHLYHREWGVYQSKFCSIPEAPWDGDLDLTGTGAALEIREDVCRTVFQPAEEWAWHLRSHTGKSLLTWRCPGLQPDQLCLIFDANTGERRTPGQLGLSSELILFFPEDTECRYGSGVELVDNWLPCSWSDWRGHLIHRQATNADITLSRGDDSKVIPWEEVIQRSPELQGTRLPGRQQTFIGVPTFWLPPCAKAQTFNVLIENLTRKISLTPANETIQLSASSDWQAIDLHPWIAGAGDYSIRLWNDGDRWQNRFSIQEQFRLSDAASYLDLQAYDRQNSFASLPIQFVKECDFELAQITLKNCWPLENIRFRLQSVEAEYFFFESASSAGDIQVDMASRHGSLPVSEGYCLSCFWAGSYQTLLSFNHKESPAILLPDLPPEPVTPTPTPTEYWLRSREYRGPLFLGIIRAELRNQDISSYFRCSADRDRVRLQPFNTDLDYRERIQFLCTSLQQRIGSRIDWEIS